MHQARRGAATRKVQGPGRTHRLLAGRCVSAAGMKSPTGTASDEPSGTSSRRRAATAIPGIMRSVAARKSSESGSSRRATPHNPQLCITTTTDREMAAFGGQRAGDVFVVFQ
jgi:hypothetical protein